MHIRFKHTIIFKMHCQMRKLMHFWVFKVQHGNYYVTEQFEKIKVDCCRAPCGISLKCILPQACERDVAVRLAKHYLCLPSGGGLCK